MYCYAVDTCMEQTYPGAMCGIAGALGTSSLSVETLRAALSALTHRGPDDQGTCIQPEKGLALGMRRLSIIDLPGGHQPIFNEDASVVVVLNGEIYNYRELAESLRSKGHTFTTNSDTEVLVHLYEDHGADLCRHLRGMFAFAIWDSKNRVLLLARDRFGQKPLYYQTTDSGGVFFASELKALMKLLEDSGPLPRISPQSIYDYLSLGVVPQPATIYEDVLSLPPATVLTCQEGEINVKPYWDLSYTPKFQGTYMEAQEELRTRIQDAVCLRLRSDVPLGVFLSGGLDSSVVAYEASRQTQDLQTFTIQVPDRDLDESGVAAETALHLGVANTKLSLEVTPLEELMFLVKHYDQPYADSSAIPSLAVSRLAREHVTVILNGDGGDEILAGYRRDLAAHMARLVDWVPGIVARAIAMASGYAAGARRSRAGFLSRFSRGLAEPLPRRYLSWTLDMWNEDDKSRFWEAGAVRPTEDLVATLLLPELSALDRQLQADIRLNLLSDLLVKMDMATMAASLEGRSPFLDHRVGEFAASLPAAYRLKARQTKSILRHAYSEHLPRAVIQGKKRGFEIPLARWLQEDLQQLLRDTLGAPSPAVAEYVDRGMIADLLDRAAWQDRNWPGMTYALLVLELWLQQERTARA